VDALDRNDIAVIGMSGAFPGAANIAEFWELLLAGEAGIVDLSPEDCIAAGVPESVVRGAGYVTRSAHLTNVKEFDADFFGYSDAEAALLDPQHRLFLQHAWLALESACYIPNQVPGVVSVFAGCGFNRYLLNKLSIDTRNFSVDDFQKMLASDKDFLASRVSYKLNLKGPSVTVQSACSTSLVAVQMACNALQTFQCDIALCGGAAVNVPHAAGYRHTDGLIFSPDGHCRPFTTQANGTLFGEGVGVVALKRLSEALEDGDIVHAVVRGAAVNNDGAQKVGYTAPSVEGQAEVISLAMELADVAPAEIDYIETHGTGTQLGDPIEIAGLKEVYASEAGQRHALGTLKANIGHLDAAAGIASFIKAVLVVRERKLPPCRYAEQVNKELLNGSGFYLNDGVVNFDADSVLNAGVSAFGVGGTNAHVVLSSPPERVVPETPPSSSTHCFVSAKTCDAAARYLGQVVSFVAHQPEHADGVAYTLATARSTFPWRVCLALPIENNPRHCAPRRALSEAQIAFLFPGQGMQFAGMAASLYRTDIAFRDQLEECLNLLRHDAPIVRSLLLEEYSPAADEQLSDTQYAQPALFITGYSLAKTLIDRGIQPTLMLGHSLGEYIAACISGVMTLKEGVNLVSLRGRLMAGAEDSAMLSVLLAASDLQPYLSGGLEISLINAPENTVVSGSPDAISELQTTLESQQIRCRRLKVSRAFHSRFVEPLVEAFADALSQVDLQHPKLPFVAMTNSYRGTDAPVWTADYWLKHLREPVDFSFAARKLLDSGTRVLLELGPGTALQSLVAAQPDFPAEVNSISSIDPKNPSQASIQQILAELWCSGVEIDLVSQGLVGKAPLQAAPVYPFERRSFWLEDREMATGTDRATAADSTFSKRELIANCWYAVFGHAIGDDDNFIDLGGDSLLGVQLANRLSQCLGLPVGLADIFQYPSIDAMVAGFGSSSASKSHFDLLFSIDGRGSGKPLFLIAGAHEDRYFIEGRSSYEEDAYRYFSTLVQNLGGKRPVYGFRPRGIIYKEEFHDSVEAMASEYILHLKRKQPEGPYSLAGECVGGLVAYEMARQLLEQGETIRSLILMDTHYPEPLFRITEMSRVLRRRVKRQFLGLSRYILRGQFASFGSELRSTLAQLLVYFFPITANLRHRRNAAFGSQIYLSLLLGYRASPLPVKVNLLVNRAWFKQNPTLGWHKLRSENIHIQAVPGDHKTRLTTHGQALGGLINSWLD